MLSQDSEAKFQRMLQYALANGASERAAKAKAATSVKPSVKAIQDRLRERHL
jgi:hypothetical protein